MSHSKKKKVKQQLRKLKKENRYLLIVDNYSKRHFLIIIYQHRCSSESKILKIKYKILHLNNFTVGTVNNSTELYHIIRNFY